jgi:D-alanine--poly(phosphoribitol) ligase subunit 2
LITFPLLESIAIRGASSMIAAEFTDKVLQLLASVSETDEVLTNLDLPLYDYQVLDSMRTVQLILMIEEEFGLKISPAEFERERWRTPRAVIADLQQRMRM